MVFSSILGLSFQMRLRVCEAKGRSRAARPMLDNRSFHGISPQQAIDWPMAFYVLGPLSFRDARSTRANFPHRGSSFASWRAMISRCDTH